MSIVCGLSLAFSAVLMGVWVAIGPAPTFMASSWLSNAQRFTMPVCTAGSCPGRDLGQMAQLRTGEHVTTCQVTHLLVASMSSSNASSRCCMTAAILMYLAALPSVQKVHEMGSIKVVGLYGPVKTSWSKFPCCRR